MGIGWLCRNASGWGRVEGLFACIVQAMPVVNGNKQVATAELCHIVHVLAPDVIAARPPADGNCGILGDNDGNLEVWDRREEGRQEVVNVHDKKINTIHVSWLVLQLAALLYLAGQLTTGACSPLRLRGQLSGAAELLRESLQQHKRPVP